jgi:hypothetical protein
MIANIVGKWYDDVFLQGNYPEVANVSANDYSAKTFAGNQVGPAVQRPFIICEDTPVTLKVQPWLGEPIVWKFTAGPYPMPLRKIFTDAANKVTETGDAITSIQIAY